MATTATITCSRTLISQHTNDPFSTDITAAAPAGAAAAAAATAAAPDDVATLPHFIKPIS